MKIEKYKNDYGTYNVSLLDDDLKVTISQTGMDHTISCRYTNFMPIDNATFEITEDEKEIYSIFSMFYNEVSTGSILGENTSQHMCEFAKNTKAYESVFHDGIVEYTSDAYPLSVPNSLCILKEGKHIYLIFDKAKDREKIVPKSPFEITINIRQSGSRIDPFHIPINSLFKRLQEVEEKDYNHKIYSKH